jgi:hypothetical protein
MNDDENKLTMEKIADGVEMMPRDGEGPTAAQVLEAAERARASSGGIAPLPVGPTTDVAVERGREVFRLRVQTSLHKQALREFKAWKHTLSEILRREARMAWGVRGEKPYYQFVLPAKLVRLVWATTINERVKMEMRRQPEGAPQRVMEQLRAEIADVVERVVKQEPEREVPDEVAHAGDDRGVAGERAPADEGGSDGAVRGGDPVGA